MFVLQIEARLSGSTAASYRNCIDARAKSADELEDEIHAYMDALQARAADAEFLDLETAARVAAGCRALLERLCRAPNPSLHRAVQAAVEYFVLEDDGEDDNSVIGFDDDLEVVRVTADVLGWEIPEINA